MEHRFGRWIDFRADVGAGHRIFVILENAPAFQGSHIDPVEGDKAFFGEGRRRAQFAGAKSGQRAAQAFQICLDGLEAVVDGRAVTEAHSLDGVTRFRRDAAGILKWAAYIAIPTCFEDGCFKHG